MECSESIKNIGVAFVKAQSELGAVVKGSDNPFFKSKYADINDVIKTIKEVLNSNGISYLQPLKVIEVAGERVSVVETVLLHTSGEFITSQTEVRSPNAADAQKFGAAVTYSRRYGLQSMVGLPAEDDDGNMASGKTETKAPPKKNLVSKKVEAKVESKVKKPSETKKVDSRWS